MRQAANRLLDFGERLLRDRRAAVRAQHRADAGHQQPQVIVDLGDRADRAARIRRRRLLVDRDRRLQALDVIDIRPLHLLEELPRVDRQALHVLPLSFGQQRIERQRAFARTADARDHDEPIARNIDIDIVQIVRPSTADRMASGMRSLHLPRERPR